MAGALDARWLQVFSVGRLTCAREAIAYARKIVADEINAATDNPLVFLDSDDENRVRSGGNLYGEAVALAMDLLAIATAELGSISERRIFRLLSAHLTTACR